VSKSDEIYGALAREIAIHKRNIAALEITIRQAGENFKATGDLILKFSASIDRERQTLADKQNALEAMDA
jgi:predicted  nucleic acid-binding Zn-ribbon protein